MRRIYGLVMAGVMAVGIAACSDQLNVVNPNNPDENRALARPTDVEQLIAGSYNTFHIATFRFDGVAPQIMCLGLENYSNLANSAMGVRSQIPRPPIANGRNATGTPESYNPWVGLHRAARSAALGLSRVNQSSFTFFPTSTTQNNRAKAFANFVMGISMGELALVYDSATIVSDLDDLSQNAPAMVAYDSVTRFAIRRLVLADSFASLAGTQTFPATWMGATGADLTVAQFRGLVRMWKLRIEIGVARSPADPIIATPSANAFWTAVDADATFALANYTADFTMNGNTSAGWDDGTMAQLYASGSANWHEMHGFMIGMADTSANYTNWLQSSFTNAILPIVSSDKRLPNGGATCNVAAPGNACRTAQQAAPGTYFENRSASTDWFGDPYGNSQYRNHRNLAWFNTAGRAAAYVMFPRSEVRLIKAEAQYNLGNYAVAAGWVDSSRVANGALPSLVGQGVTTNVATITGPGCVPRVPHYSGATSTTTCGTLLEALKYEKRMETAYTWMGGWYFDSRRWGDLPEGTPLYWPVPYQESDARNTTNFYVTGGSGPSAAPVGTYGL